MAGLTRAQTVNRALSFRGVSESPPYSNRVMFSAWYGFTGPWCAMFVSYVLYHSGHPLPIRTRKGFAYCPDVVGWAQNNNRWFTNRDQAKPGDLILYSFGGRRADHVGMVVGRLPDGRMHTIEGNTGSDNRDGGSVQERYRNSGILGFVRLDYPSTAPSPPKPPKPEIKESDMLFFFTYEGSDRTFMSDGFHYREVSDKDQDVYTFLYVNTHGKQIPKVTLDEKQVKRMIKIGP